LAAVAAVPAALVLFALVGMWPTEGEAPLPVAGTVQVAKVGDQVVFTIDNGGQPHRIQKSDRPDRFDGSATLVQGNGGFADRLESDSEIVFYRID
jgi:hypothetical protein